MLSADKPESKRSHAKPQKAYRLFATREMPPFNLLEWGRWISGIDKIKLQGYVGLAVIP